MPNPLFLILFYCVVFPMFLCAQGGESLKSIQGIYKGHQPHMVGDGFRVFNYFPHGNPIAEQVSPFILLDYNAPHYFSSSQLPRGVGTHPHRGFETVTIVYEGALAHKDSTGAGGVIRAGDVQWMTAASGILHQEFHEAEFSKQGGTLHAVQLWVNLPAKDKMTPPKYQTLRKTDLTTFEIDNRGSVVRVIAGEFQGKKGPATTFTPIHVYDIRLRKDAEVFFDLPESYNNMLLVTTGSLIVNQEKPVGFKDLLLFGQRGEKIILKASEDSMVLVLSGAPINEPIVQAGPFVMNTQQEIIQAQRDYNSGKFGYLD